MQQPNQGYCVGNSYRRVFRASNSIAFTAAAVLLFTLFPPVAKGANDTNGFVLERENRTIVLEPYAPNIIRITLSTNKPAAVGAPGYGVIGKPAAADWNHERDSSGYDVVHSGRMTVRVAPEN